MLIGAAAWGLRETPLEEQLKLVGGLGLGSLELSIAGHENDFLQVDSSAKDIEYAAKLFSDNGLALVAAATGNDFTQAEEGACLADLARLEKVVAIAGKLGVKYLRVFAGFSRVEEVAGKRWEVMVDCLKKANDKARECGVCLAMETHGGVEEVAGGIRHFYSTSSKPEVLRKLLGEIPADMGLVFDPANLGAVGMSTAEVIALYKELKDRIYYLHLKDFRQVSAEAILPCACGEGGLDWRELKAVFAAFAGYGFVEYEIPADIEDGMRRSIACL